MIERAAGEVGALAERLFFEAAITYRHSGKARQNLTSWPTDKELMEGLDGLLGDLVQDPASVGGLSDNELALAVADDWMTVSGSERAGLALARLVRLENGRGNYEGANDAATRFIAGFAP